MTWYQTQTGRVHYWWVWLFSFNAGGERWFASMWARLILTNQLVEFDTPALGYSYAHLCVKISASVLLFVPLEACMRIDRYCIGVQSLNSFLVIFLFVVCYPAQCSCGYEVWFRVICQWLGVEPLVKIPVAWSQASGKNLFARITLAELTNGILLNIRLPYLV